MDTSPRPPAARHRRSEPDAPLVRVRDRSRRPLTRGPWRLPAPRREALAGIAALILIGAGAVHLADIGGVGPVSAAPQQVAAGSTADGAADANGAADADGAGEPDGAGSAEGAPAASPAAPASPAATAASTTVTVHVSGEVAEPGVVDLPVGSRVDDAVHAAGGAMDGAQLDQVNLARPLTDGEQIHIPAAGEQMPPSAGEGASSPHGASPPQGSASAADGSEGGTININTASAEQLDELPGVGPAIAQRIIEHRELNGSFASVDDLEAVSGIGPATLEKMRDKVTV